MRSLILICFATSLVSQTGCSVTIARSGTNLSLITSRDEVIEMFGPPSSSVQKESTTVEEFKTRKKIADSSLAAAYGMEFCMLGIFEPANFSRELIGMTRNTIFGQNIRFEFDESGEIISFENDDFMWKYNHLMPIRRMLFER